MESKKFYWLKLKRDFFKRHDIRIIEGMPNGSEILLFYLKLMLESVDHEGRLRFSDKVPYTAEMLSVITDTELDIVEQGIDALECLELLERDDKGTYVLPMVITMIDSASDTDGARRMRRLREQNANNLCGDSEQNVQKNEHNRTKSDESIENRDKRLEKRVKSNKFVSPTLEEVKAYCQERNSSVDPLKFFEYYETGDWKDAKGNPVKNWKQKLITWEKKDESVPRRIQPQGESFVDLIERWEAEDE